MGSYSNEIEQFIYEICYQPMWEAAYTYVYQHPYALDLTYSKVRNPDSAVLEDMVLEFPCNIMIKEDTLLFDAVVSCTINLTEDNYRGFASHEISQWLRISCKAVVTDKLDSLDITNIRNYRPETNGKKTWQSVSKNIVPILYKKDLEHEAEVFLSQYCPDALEKPTRVPIESIADQMHLTVVQGSCITDDFSIFGEICFSKGEVEVYDLFKCSKTSLKVERGTILIDAYTYWERNRGCVNNTIAHEVYHWYKHRMYAAIKHILRNEKFIACRCPADMSYPNENEEWTDEQRMEWQANSMAPRILMPIKTFKIKVDELYKKYRYTDSELKPLVLESIARELADFYEVSRQSVLIRMMEVGYKEAAGIYQYDDKSPFHNYVDESDAFYAYSTNADLRYLLNSGLFRYVENYFVINDDVYVYKGEDGHFHLTDNAWEHLSECTLKFTWTRVQKNDHPHLPDVLMHRANAAQQVSDYQSNQNDNVIELSEELKRKREEFEKQTSAYRLTTPERTSWQLMHDIIQQRGISKAHFCSLTGLDEIVYRRAEKNEKTMPSMSTIMAFACGLDLDLETTKKILQLAGHTFNDTNQHRALMFCVTGFSGRPIEERNRFLESYGYPPLGSKQLK